MPLLTNNMDDPENLSYLTDAVEYAKASKELLKH